MKTFLAHSCIEPLEQRIAPALLVYGANLLGGAENPSQGESSIGENTSVVVKVLSGQALVWWDGHHITGISVGPNTSLDILGDVGPGPSTYPGAFGSIVANLTAEGRLSDSDNDPSNGEDGKVILDNDIIGITTHPLTSQKGSIGQIITGGSVSNVFVNGGLNGIYAGDGWLQAGSRANTTVDVGVEVNPFLTSSPTGFTFDPVKSHYKSGASISNVTIQTAIELQIFAGNGFLSNETNFGGAGGNIQGIRISDSYVPATSTNLAYTLRAGDGASGGTGGAGGSISKVIEVSSSGEARMIAGHGGDGSSGAGGAGGSITGLDLQSSITSYSLQAGVGGKGTPGGAGGNVSQANFSGNSLGAGLILSGNFLGNGFSSDLLIVDTNSGKMMIMANGGMGTSFTPVLQDNLADWDPTNDLYTIAPKGSHPVDAVVRDMNSDGLVDIVVGYADGVVGTYLNTPKMPGVFVKQNFSESGYSGNELTGSSYSIQDTPITKLVVGDFGGNTLLDIASLSVSKGRTTLTLGIATGNDAYTADQGVALSGTGSAMAVEMTSGATDYIAVGFTDGRVVSYDPKDGAVSQVQLTGSIASLDSAYGELLALTKTGSLSLLGYASNGGLSTLTGPDLTTQTGKPIAAHFAGTSIAVLSKLGTGSRIDVYNYSSGAYGLQSSVSSPVPFSAFAPTVEGSSLYGIAALPGTLGQIQYSLDGGAFQEFSIPLVQAAKTIRIEAGQGGDGVDLLPVLPGKVLLGKGGNGGSISSINAEAYLIEMLAGNGGDSQAAAAGAGGSISNPASMTTLSGTAVVPTLNAEGSLVVAAGGGGAPSSYALLTAIGGNGGGLTGLSLQGGDSQLTSGNGGNGNGGIAGNAGNVTGIKSHLLDGNLEITTGRGGDAVGAKVKGGNGGSIVNLTHFLDLQDEPDGLEIVEKPYWVVLTAGEGGNSAAGPAGAGGSLTGLDLKLDPSHETYNSYKKHDTDYMVNLHGDSTVRVMLQAGDGGTGAIGGAGGSVSKLKSRTIFDQTDLDDRTIVLNPVVMSIQSGNGGDGTNGPGGVGGAINLGTGTNLLGLTHFDSDAEVGFVAPTDLPNFDPNTPYVSDPSLRIVSGHGGNGTTSGGAGGAITSVSSANARFFNGSLIVGQELYTAYLLSGNGGNGQTGDGGAGGSISKLSIGAAGLAIQSGAGGDGGSLSLVGKTARGGAGGSITNAIVGSIYSGVDLLAGPGGDGITAGGNGGSISSIQLNCAQGVYNTHLLAGDGGNATMSKMKAGNGGDVAGITHTKDLNSAINLIEAGNGGSNALGIGGNGGSVKTIREAGFIGQPGYGALDPYDNPQGLFVGRGGSGATVGKAGSVLDVRARQIAAIAAAMDEEGLFGLAFNITGVTADLIGYDAPAGAPGVYNDSTITGGVSPTQIRPLDGFILSTTISKIITNDSNRTAKFINPPLMVT